MGCISGQGKTEFWLVAIETLGNQKHIFGSNKRREMLGASEQILRCTTEWLLARLGHPLADLHINYADQISGFLRDPSRNAPCAAGRAEFEAVILASGKALLLTCAPCKAQELIADLGVQAQAAATGLQLLGAVSPEPFALTSASAFHAQIGLVYQRLADLRGRIGLSDARFLRTPFSEDC